MAELLPITNTMVNPSAVGSKNPGIGSEVTGEQSGVSEAQGNNLFNPILQRMLTSQSGSTADKAAITCEEGDMTPSEEELAAAVADVAPEVDMSEELRKVMELKTVPIAATFTIACADVAQAASKQSVQNVVEAEQAKTAVADAAAASGARETQVPTQIPVSRPAISIDLIEATQIHQPQPLVNPAQRALDQAPTAVSYAPLTSQQPEGDSAAVLGAPGITLNDSWRPSAGGENAEASVLETISQLHINNTKNSFAGPAATVTEPTGASQPPMAVAVPSLQNTEAVAARKPIEGEQSHSKNTPSVIFDEKNTSSVLADGTKNVVREKNSQVSFDYFLPPGPGLADAQQPIAEKETAPPALALATPEELKRNLSTAAAKGMASVAGASSVLEQKPDESLKRPTSGEINATKAEGPTPADTVRGKIVAAPRTESNTAQNQNEDGRPVLSRPEQVQPVASEVKGVLAGDAKVFPSSARSVAGKEGGPESQSDIRDKDTEAGRPMVAVKPQQPGSGESTKSDMMATLHSGPKVPGLSSTRPNAPELGSAKTVNLPPDLLSSVQDQIAKAVSLKLTDNVSEMKVLLTPETLGEVTIKVRMEEGTMAARIDVSQANVRAALEASLPQLREALSSRGIQVERIDILNASYSSSKESHNQSREKSRGSLRRGEESDGLEAYEGGRFLGYNTLDYLV